VKGETRQLQNLVSLSALYDCLAAQGYRVASPRGLMRLDRRAQGIVERWLETSVDALEDVLLAINYLINPEEILIGGRLPAGLVDRLASRLNDRLRTHAATMPAVAHIRRAAMSDDAPAVGAAILPFSDRFPADPICTDEEIRRHVKRFASGESSGQFSIAGNVLMGARASACNPKVAGLEFAADACRASTIGTLSAGGGVWGTSPCRPNRINTLG
jgi:hypothetical protein